MSRDPVVESGGYHLYSFSRNEPIRHHDAFGLLFGLPSEEDNIRNNRLQYTCMCGWIDWGHAHAGPQRQNLWQSILDESGEPGLGGFRVEFYETIFGSVALGGGSYLVKNGLTLPQKKSAALGVFQHANEAFEAWQDLLLLFGFFGDSGWSEPDLPSDLIGFYRVVNNVTVPEVYKNCGQPIDTCEALKLYREKGFIKNKHWKPARDLNSCTTTCAGKTLVWPALFNSITPAPQGGMILQGDKTWRPWSDLWDGGEGAL